MYIYIYLFVVYPEVSLIWTQTSLVEESDIHIVAQTQLGRFSFLTGCWLDIPILFRITIPKQDAKILWGNPIYSVILQTQLLVTIPNPVLTSYHILVDQTQTWEYLVLGPWSSNGKQSKEHKGSQLSLDMSSHRNTHDPHTGAASAPPPTRTLATRNNELANPKSEAISIEGPPMSRSRPMALRPA